MGRKAALLALALIGTGAEGHSLAPLYDPVVLNVGVNCQWHQTCERRQMSAMSDARRYVARAHPPDWRIHMCNRNAARGPSRMDWIGFDNCIRNSCLNAPLSRGH